MSWVTRMIETSKLLELAQLVEDLALHDDVEGGDRLVGDDQFRIEGECQRDRDALPHAAGKLVGKVAQPAGLDPDHLEELLAPVAGLAGVHTAALL